MTEDKLAELRRLCDRATPPPWVSDGYRLRAPNHPNPGCGGVLVEWKYLDGTPFDGEFMAAARTAVPELLAELDRLAARVRELEGGGGQRFVAATEQSEGA